MTRQKLSSRQFWKRMLWPSIAVAALISPASPQDGSTAEIPLPSLAPSSATSPKRYNKAPDTHVPPEVAQFLSPLPAGVTEEYIDPGARDKVQVKLDSPLSGRIAQDPLQKLFAPSDEHQLIYAANPRDSKGQPPTGDFLVWTRITGGKATATSYPLTTSDDDYIMEPQFLSDHQVLFKLGYPYDRNGDFHLYLLNLNTSQIRKLTSERITYEEFEVSPDNRYIAYVQGGDRMGASAAEDGFPLANGQPSLSLYVLDVQSGKSTLIVRDDSITKGGFCWTPKDTLLYSLLPAPQAPPKRAPGQAPFSPTLIWARPNLYEVPATGGQSKLLVRDAWRPRVSPDGKQIAFFGAQNPEENGVIGQHWGSNPYQALINIVNRDGSGRHSLSLETQSYPRLFWLPDSRHLLTFKIEEKDVGNNGDVELHPVIRIWDLQTNSASRVAFADEKYPAVSPLKISNDGEFLIVQNEELQDTVNSNFYDRNLRVWRLKLSDGSVEPLFQMKNGFGIDYQ